MSKLVITQKTIDAAYEYAMSDRYRRRTCYCPMALTVAKHLGFPVGHVQWSGDRGMVINGRKARWRSADSMDKVVLPFDGSLSKDPGIERLPWLVGPITVDFQEVHPQ